MTSTRAVFNGVHATTGRYLAPSMNLGELVAALRDRPRRARAGGRGLAFGDRDDLAEAGWGAVFPRDGDPAVAEALAPLLDLRRDQAARGAERRFRVFAGQDGLLPGESKHDFLYRHGVGPGPVEPDRMPYYLLLVGEPDEIPYEFQYQLDVQYAVGRLAFDSPWEYRQYAETVVAAERGRVRRPRSAAILAPQNPGDEATALAAEHLAAPLAAGMAAAARTAGGSPPRSVRRPAGPASPVTSAARRRRRSCSRPATASSTTRGPVAALLPGSAPVPGLAGGRGLARPARRGHFFAAGDVGPEADVAGLVAFLFACYGAGTPALDDFDRSLTGRTRTIAPAPLVARLPQRLLAHPRGGALAVVGHVERAWTYSFLWGRAAQIGLFEGTLRELLAGRRVGAAMELFAQRLGEMGSELIHAFERQERGERVGDDELLRLWNAHHDARNYVVLGDPAVRVAAVEAGAEAAGGG